MIVIFLIGFASALMSAMSGAGAALFATPLLLLCGVGLPAVLASNQLSAAVWTPVASRNYLRGCRLDTLLVLGVASVGLMGVMLGYRAVIWLPVDTLKHVIGAIILLIVVLVYLREAFLDGRERIACHRSIPITLGLPLGAYQAIFGSGNTLFSSLVFCRTCSFDLKRALAHSYAVAFVWCSSAALLFYLEGWLLWEVALPASAGSLVGAYLGSKVGSLLSAPALRKVFLFFGAIMGVKLLLLG